MLDKWKGAVIHLECAGDSDILDDHNKRMARLRTGEITPDQGVRRERRERA